MAPKQICNKESSKRTIPHPLSFIKSLKILRCNSAPEQSFHNLQYLWNLISITNNWEGAHHTIEVGDPVATISIHFSHASVDLGQR